jgi:hypothetical protein
MNKLVLPAVFTLSAVVTLAATLPLSVALHLAHAGEKGLAARDVTGSVWDGTLHAAEFAGTSLGNVLVRFDSKSLLMGAPSFVAETSQGTFVFYTREGITRFPEGQL